MSKQKMTINKSQGNVQLASKGGKFWNVLKIIGWWVYRFRGLLMAIPVATVAIIMAMQNLARLPDRVGIYLLASGEYQWMVAKVTAITVPLLVTGACLVLMFLSRRTVYPWLISIFSLILPVLIYITNVFPA